MPYASVAKENSGEVRLYYEDHGSGSAVVLIHGYPLSGASWELQTAALLQAGHRVITYDRRGFGKSDQPAEGYNYDTFAEDLRKLIQHLQLNDCALVGFSMGGGEIARYIGKFGSKGISKAAIIGGVPPFLLKTADNPQGLDRAVFEGIKKSVAADRYAFFTEFFKNFFNTDALKLKVEHLAKPENLTPPASQYLVWIARQGAGPENVGKLTVGNDLKANLDVTTPFKSFRIFVTAEASGTVAAPSGMEVLHAEVSS